MAKRFPPVVALRPIFNRKGSLPCAGWRIEMAITRRMIVVAINGTKQTALANCQRWLDRHGYVDNGFELTCCQQLYRRLDVDRPGAAIVEAVRYALTFWSDDGRLDRDDVIMAATMIASWAWPKRTDQWRTLARIAERLLLHGRLMRSSTTVDELLAVARRRIPVMAGVKGGAA